MYGAGGIVGILAGLIALISSAFWPENTHLAIMLLTFGALGCSWEGASTGDTAYATLWTSVGVVTAAFVMPFHAVFCAPVLPFFPLLVGFGVLCLAMWADRYAGGKDTPSTLSSRAAWPLVAFIAFVGALTALLIHWIQP